MERVLDGGSIPPTSTKITLKPELNSVRGSHPRNLSVGRWPKSHVVARDRVILMGVHRLRRAVD